MIPLYTVSTCSPKMAAHIKWKYAGVTETLQFSKYLWWQFVVSNNVHVIYCRLLNLICRVPPPYYGRRTRQLPYKRGEKIYLPYTLLHLISKNTTITTVLNLTGRIKSGVLTHSRFQNPWRYAAFLTELGSFAHRQPTNTGTPCEILGAEDSDLKTSNEFVESSWNVMAHGEAREAEWMGNWRMEWVASTLHTTSEHGVSSITTADAHTSAASSRLNWRPPPI